MQENEIDFLFKIQNLQCAYNLIAADKVLQINELIIPKNSLTFLLGASGCGKSTLLETLGLMNNTIAGGNILFNPEVEGYKINLNNIWETSNQSQLNSIRKKHYSFIFQNTNLMENFTAYENVCLSGMIKENIAQEDAMPKAKMLMEKIKLPENEVNLTTLAVNLSGGQRQRLAFVRALNNNASVLFCDEPTGNLDEANANELFEIIKSNLHEGLSAIVVSHDINLAVKYADQIIVITKDIDKGYGEVKAENIIYRKDIEGKSDTEIVQVKNKIRNLYKTGNEQKKVATQQGAVDLSNLYRKLFLRKEGKTLFGKRNVNLIVLVTILSFTFLAIGFGNGSLNYLDVKMNSAFVNWLPITIPFGKSGEDFTKELKKDLNNRNLKEQYKYQNVTMYAESPMFALKPSINDYYRVKARSVDVANDSKLIKEDILSEKNVIVGKKGGFKNENDIAVIVTQRFLTDFGYPENTTHINLQYSIKDTASNKYIDIGTPIPIRAIVHELPGKYGMIYTTYFLQAWINDRSDNFNILTKNKTIEFFYANESKEKAEQLKNSIKNILKLNSDFKQFSPEIYLKADTESFVNGYHLEIEFLPNLPNHETSLKFENLIKSDPQIQAFKNDMKRVYNFDYQAGNFKEPTYDQISIYFNKLDKVRDFSTYFYDKYNKKGASADIIEVDISKVKEKENFNFLSNVTSIISYLLVVFSTIAVGLFLYNLLKLHLLKVKMNIGTFKAIGLSDKEAKSIYFNIIMFFICLSITIGLVIASIIGLALDKILSENLAVEKGINYFKIIDVNTFITVLIIFITSTIIVRSTINNILSKTPGDLIYNR